MSNTTNLILIAGLVLALACFVYLYFGAKRLEQQRNARVSGDPKPAVAVAAPEPAAAALTPFLATPDGAPDDLGRIKGIGPKLSARLNELGVFHYRQIAQWTPEQLAAVDAQLGNFQGRPQRDQWQSQAALLASGDVKGYERVHGKLGPAAPPA